MKKNMKLSTFKFFILTYLVIMLIPFLTCGMLYTSLLSALNRNNDESYYSALSQSQQVINQYLEGISNIPAQILSNAESSAFLNSNILNNNEGLYQPSIQLNIISHLNSYTSSNPLLDDIYLYSHENDYFLSSTTSFPALSYGVFFKIGDMDYRTLKTKILSYFGYNRLYYQTRFISKGNSKNCFYFVTTIPLQETEKITGAILISIDSSKLFKAIENTLPENSYFYFYDSQKNIISQSSDAPNIKIGTGNKKTEVIDTIEYTIYQTNESNYYNYALAIPSHTVTANINLARIIITFTLFLSCVVSGFLAYYFTKHNTRPIDRILYTLRPYSNLTGDLNNDYNIISDSVANLINTNKNSIKLLEDNMPILRSNFLHSILSGEFLDKDEIMQSINQLNLSFDYSQYIICIISIVTTSTFSVSKVAALKTFISEKLLEEYICLYTYINEIQTVFLLCLSDEGNPVQELESSLNKLADKSNEEFNVMLKFSISEPFTSFFDTFYKYCDAKNIMEHGIQTVYNNAIWCTQGLSSNTGYYYPADVEKRIIHSFQHKNIEIVFETLDSVLKENHEKRVLSSTTIKHLYSDIKCTIFKILYNLSLSTETIENVEKSFSDNPNLSLPDFFRLVETLLTKIHNLLNENSSEERLADVMMKYIDTHYCDPSLSRQTFSNHFHISEAYTSRFFKEYTGYQFTEYITKIRMEAACKLLTDTNLTISKIAHAVGYNSDVSFRRVFKSFTGMTPKEYQRTQFP